MKKAGILFANQSKIETMKQTTFSRMSQPDLMLTLTCYAERITKLRREISQIDRIPIVDEGLKKERISFEKQIYRLEELSAAIIEAYGDEPIIPLVRVYPESSCSE